MIGGGLVGRRAGHREVPARGYYSSIGGGSAGGDAVEVLGVGHRLGQAVGSSIGITGIDSVLGIAAGERHSELIVSGISQTSNSVIVGADSSSGVGPRGVANQTVVDIPRSLVGTRCPCEGNR